MAVRRVLPEAAVYRGRSRIALLLASAALLGGCGSDPNEASEENFKRILAPLVEKRACTALPASDATEWAHEFGDVQVTGLYPLTAQVAYGYNFGIRQWVEGGVFRGDPGAIDTYQRLVDLGALERRDAPITYEDFTVGLGVGATKRPRHFAYFTPTEAAKTLFSEMEATRGRNVGTTVPALCFGKGYVESIDNFTIPGEGEIQSTIVTYTWRTDPLNAVAQAVYDAHIPLVYRKPPLSETASIRLVLTNNGWAPAERSNF